MFITRECDYAIRIIRGVSDGELHSIQSICEAEDIAVPVAYKLARKLEQAGLLRSVRGPKGGYALSGDLHTLTLYDICQVVDKELFISQCMRPDHDCSRNPKEFPCRVHCELARIQQIMNRELKKYSLYEIMTKEL